MALNEGENFEFGAPTDSAPQFSLILMSGGFVGLLLGKDRCKNPANGRW